MTDLEQFDGRDGRTVSLGDAVYGVSHLGMRFRGTLVRIVQGKRLNAFIRRDNGNTLVVEATCVQGAA